MTNRLPIWDADGRVGSANDQVSGTVGTMRAKELRDLHEPGSPLVLPNVWDADTAKLVVDAGFPVVATSSAAVAASLGYPDGEHAAPKEMFAAAARISAAVDAPLTVDVESGYGLPVADLVEELFAVDAVGCNVEDTDQASGIRRSAQEQAGRIATMKRYASDALVVNARIDSFLGAEGADDERAALPDAVERARAYLDAGADCVYPIHLRAPEVLAEFVAGVDGAPVNATLLQNGPDLQKLSEIGVARVSLGTTLWRAQRAWMSRTLAALKDGATP